MIPNPIRPGFLLIGAQKAGTTWLWEMLRQHDGTSLPDKKEIHYFGASELFGRGWDWYLEHFQGLDSSRLVGEASTSYFFDRVPFWFNEDRKIEYDARLDPIPRLVRNALPDSKIIVVLRDPVKRAISAYRHWMKKGDLSPLAGLKSTALRHPKLRIIEYGHYLQHLEAWYGEFPADRILPLLFEEDVIGDPRNALQRVYGFLGLNAEFEPCSPEQRVHESWSWTRSAVSYYARPLRGWINRGRLGRWLDEHDWLESVALRQSDIDYLRSIYLPERPAIKRLLNRSLDC